MADTQSYYDSPLSGEELDAAFRRIPQIDASVQAAANSAGLAESWAVGGTGLREGEDADCAQYWCNQAQTIAQGALGWYESESSLQAAYPTGENGQWAIVGTTDTIWTWDSDTGAWVDTGAQIDLSNYYTKPQSDARFQMPVGYIFDWAPVEGQTIDLSTPEKVAAHFGYGTWAEITGRFTFGRDDAHAVGSTGGEENHKLTVNEMPSHRHNQQGYYSCGDGGKACMTTEILSGDSPRSSSLLNAGGDQPHNNMPPYLTVYKWQRVA